jgi:hypothetical protein
VPFYPQVQYIVVGRDARDVFMSVWNHHANYAPGFLDTLNGLPDRVGDPMPAAPDNIHEFWRGWITRGWFPWESEGYPYWGNLHHTRTWWDYRHLLYHAQFSFMAGNGRNPNYAWRFDPQGASGVLGDYGAHMINLAHYLVGEIGRVQARLTTNAPRNDPPVGPFTALATRRPC